MEAATSLRADARRNRERIVAAAAAGFAAEGIDCQVAGIARRAGVGNATVFRHFPTKEALLIAVVERRMGEIVALAEEAVGMEDPEAGLRALLEGVAEVHVTDHGLKQMAAAHFHGHPALVAARDGILARLGTLVARARDAGVVRRDVEPIDLVVLVNGVAAAVEGLEDARPGLWRRYLTLALDAMRPEAAGALPLAPGAPTPDELEAAWRRQALARGGCGA